MTKQNNYDFDTSFGVNLPMDIYQGLEKMTKIDGSQYGVSSYARTLLVKGMAEQTFPEGSSSKYITIRTNTVMKEDLEKEAMKRDISRGELVRNILVYQLNKHFDASAPFQKESVWRKLPLLLRGLALTLSFLCIFFIGGFAFKNLQPHPEQSIERGYEAPAAKKLAFLQHQDRVFDGLLNRGTFYYEQAEYDLAKTDFETAQHIKETPLLLNYLAKTYEKLGQEEKMEELVRKLELLE